jgi:ribosomal protein S18 acetylase RimI-like enzyme
VEPASPRDARALQQLINAAYRADGGRQGWTHEVALFGRAPRIDEAGVRALFQDPKSIVLKCVAPAGALIGCVHLRLDGERVYLGLLSVSPSHQNQGIGKRLLAASETHAANLGATSIYMTVISARTELIAWYVRHGYAPTGEREALPGQLAVQAAVPLEFVVLEKLLGGAARSGT